MLHNTRYLALPIKWCELNGANKQSVMDIMLEEDGSLKISPEGSYYE